MCNAVFNCETFILGVMVSMAAFVVNLGYDRDGVDGVRVLLRDSPVALSAQPRGMTTQYCSVFF